MLQLEKLNDVKRRLYSRVLFTEIKVHFIMINLYAILVLYFSICIPFM